MKNKSTFQKELSKVFRWEDKQYDLALKSVEKLQESWPGNSQLYILWASLVQLQDAPEHDLNEVKAALRQSVELNKNSPDGAIELGYYLDTVEDNPQAASEAFSEGIHLARRWLIAGLLGQAKALLQLDEREKAFKCLTEAIYLANSDDASNNGESPDVAPDIHLRDEAGQLSALELKGPFALKVEDLLQEFFPKRSA